MKLSETKAGNKLSVLLIGYPGAGKSIAAASFPRPVYIFDLDRRIDALLRHFGTSDDIEHDYYGPEDYIKLDAMIDRIKAGDSPFKTYIMDSLTAFARMSINYSMSLRGKGSTGNIQKGVVQMTSIEDYGAETVIIRKMIDTFRGKNFRGNFIMTAHLVETSTKALNEAEVVRQRLLTAGKGIAAELPAYFNEVYYIYKDVNRIVSPPDVKYLATTVPMNGIDTKTALPLPHAIDFTMRDPKDPGLYQKIQMICKEKGIEIG